MSVATICALASRASSRWMIIGVKSYPWRQRLAISAGTLPGRFPFVKLWSFLTI